MFGVVVTGAKTILSARLVALLVVATIAYTASPIRKSLTNQPNNTNDKIRSVIGVLIVDCI
jgi:hypothetical protein